MDSGNGYAVAENPATVTRSSGQTTCDAGGDNGAMLEADKECSETEHQTDDEEVTFFIFFYFIYFLLKNTALLIIRGRGQLK